VNVKAASMQAYRRFFRMDTDFMKGYVLVVKCCEEVRHSQGKEWRTE